MNNAVASFQTRKTTTLTTKWPPSEEMIMALLSLVMPDGSRRREKRAESRQMQREAIGHRRKKKPGNCKGRKSRRHRRICDAPTPYDARQYSASCSPPSARYTPNKRNNIRRKPRETINWSSPASPDKELNKYTRKSRAHHFGTASSR